MSRHDHIENYYLNQVLGGYTLVEEVGSGQIGVVYRAVRTAPSDTLACKIVPADRLKRGWEREIQKLTQLRGLQDIVQYHSHDAFLDRGNRPSTYVFFDFVNGQNLRDCMNALPSWLDMSFIENLLETLLRVLLACQAVGIEHGDIHPGNIMIADPDPRLFDSTRRVLVADFGYGGSHNGLQPKDDFRQVASVVGNLLTMLRPSDLNARDRILQHKLAAFLRKHVAERDPTQGQHVRNPRMLIEEFRALKMSGEREAAAVGTDKDVKAPGDYLSAEMIGYRKEEWRDLFVPGFLAAQDLLGPNITVLTGARGCGKTMVFRRLTAFMDSLIGTSSGVPGSESFVGFYLNCRDISDAFPWLPTKLTSAHQQQILHFFHLAWMSEVCRTLSIIQQGQVALYDWLDGFLAQLFGSRYWPMAAGRPVLAHAQAFVEAQKEECRLSGARNRASNGRWPLARIDFLDLLQGLLEANVPQISEKPMYMFLDDYTVPTISRDVQRTLNATIFRRRSKIFFKISTEAANSFERSDLRGKPLELHQDFQLIDLATESLHMDDDDKVLLLDQIFRPRIDRHPLYNDRKHGLKDILGINPQSNNALARLIRDQGGTKQRIVYYGLSAFSGMWSSDIRIMIQMFADMLRDASGNLSTDSMQIEPKIQNNCYRTQGGEFLTFAQSVTNPNLWEKIVRLDGTHSYGKHLHDIVEAFINVSRYELTKGPLVKNENAKHPKQAFRIEIRDKFELPDDANDYYQGLIRWHIFLQDWRGKSQRGMITPRLYMNRVLIPLAYLTFSSHDSIGMSNEDFIRLLRDPKDFPQHWEKQRMRALSKQADHPHLEMYPEGEENP